MYQVKWSARAIKHLDKLDRQTARAIARFLEDRVHGSANPRVIGKPLRGENLWRYRVGDYRILCHIDDEILTVLVVELGHRREVYRR